MKCIILIALIVTKVLRYMWMRELSCLLLILIRLFTCDDVYLFYNYFESPDITNDEGHRFIVNAKIQDELFNYLTDIQMSEISCII